MSEINDGGPAFGQVVEMRCVHVDPFGATELEPALAQGGMSLRDYFAAKAMGNFFARNRQREHVNSPEQIASFSYEIADAMLKARQP